MAAPARTIDHAEIAALRARVRERRLVEPDDYLVIDDLLGLASDLTVALAPQSSAAARRATRYPRRHWIGDRKRDVR